MKKRLVRGLILCFLIGCLTSGCGSKKKVVTSTKQTSDTQKEDTTDQADNKDKTYSVGEAVTVQGENTKLEFTITDYGSFYNGHSPAMIYIKYHAKNLGKNAEVIGQNNFSIYADDYAVSNTTLEDSMYGPTSDNVELASGKMANGIFFAQIDTEEVAKLEVKVNDQKTYVLQHRKSGSIQNTESQNVENDNSDDSYDDTSDSDDSDYILPESDTDYVSSEEIDELSAREKRLAINEIYARHGRKFDNAEVREYFESQSWYHGTIDADDFDESVLNKYEQANIKKIADSQWLKSGVKRGGVVKE